MQITVKSIVDGDVRSVIIEFDRGDMVRSLIVAFCIRIDIPAPESIQMKNDSGVILNKDSTLAEAGVHNGDTLYILQTDSNADGDHHHVRVKPAQDKEGACSAVLLAVGFVLVTGSILGIIVLVMKFTSEICTNQGYGAVFDAGSSHTNMTVYSWPNDTRVDETGFVTQKATCRALGGGISSYTDTPQAAGDSLRSCLDAVKDVISEQYYEYTSLYLGATAGMRLLRETQQATSDSIMTSVQTTMASYPYNFTANQATIISGSEEGTYGWVSTNFLAGTLNSPSLFGSLAATFFTNPLPTYGALDLGGASTQITFIPEDISSMPENYTAHLRLYGVDYTLYTHSYLCYGINEALRRFKAYLVKDGGYKELTINPCAPEGYSEVIDDEYLWKAPCSKGPQALAGWGTEVMPPHDTDTPSTYNFTGTSDAAACAAAVESLIDVNASCSHPPCSFNGVYQPKPNGKFMAFSTFEKIIVGLGLPRNATIEEIQNKTQSFCAETYDQVKNLPGDPHLLVLYCFEINYLSTLLFKGYGFDPQTWKVTFTDEVKGQELGWSLGFMINASNLIPTEASCSKFSVSGFYIGIPVVAVCFLVGVILLVAAVYRYTWRKRKIPYEELGTPNDSNKYGSV
ncbi:ectonucleoside triphosphate diphosphohydrolase 8-like [Asterias rubens]|uniref:ectonucleoside triphosphate diphosphohydrolase 8-like n=1 Tax=Asterias rubens TaxID=7604 RepID=UPI00145557C4|nr:ectonucleoside triphosphate diphosphohydrolase 8-like [Asterias rubens]XP_033632928.1 ectonucleoside triphosphate diphosphohydrolase 8-like [Asterias rubens]